MRRRHDWGHEFDHEHGAENPPTRVMTCSTCGRQERVSIFFITNDLLDERTCRGRAAR